MTRPQMNIADGPEEQTVSASEFRLATLNILEDFSAEKARLEETQRAILNILEDFGDEKRHLEDIQRATLNILEDFNAEKMHLEEIQRAVLNILEDFDLEKTKVEQANLLLERKSKELNRSNEELQKTHAALELRVQERTADLRRTNLQLRTEMEERKKAGEQVQKSLQEKDVLLREIHHRVKNNLQIIQSMLNLQLPQIKDEKTVALFKESQDRVFSMALIHEKLYQSETLARINFDEYISSLVNHLFLSYGAAGRAIRSKISTEGIILDVDVTIPCALIVNELVSNALKHAFPTPRPKGAAGEISVGLRHGQENLFLLTICDNGTGLPEDFDVQQSASLGLKLVLALVRQLQGSIHMSRSCGVGFTISFPAKIGKGDHHVGHVGRQNTDR